MSSTRYRRQHHMVKTKEIESSERSKITFRMRSKRSKSNTNKCWPLKLKLSNKKSKRSKNLRSKRNKRKFVKPRSSKTKS
jgi:hypothetical protein